MKRNSIATAGLLLAFAPALAHGGSLVLDAPPFDGIDASSGVKVVASVGVKQSVTAESALPADLSELRWEVRENILHLRYDGNTDPASRQIVVTIAVPRLVELEASSGARIEASGIDGDIDIEASSGASISATTIKAGRYGVEAASGARIELSGPCDTLEAEISSGASVVAPTLYCGRAEIEASSSGSIEIAVSTSISAEISSGASLLVHGQPGIESLDTSSGGSVRFVN